MSSGETEIVFYDLPGKPPRRCFSPNCMKTRSALNFKHLPYRTVFLEWPDVKSTLENLGVQANQPEESWLEYTCPTVQLPDGRFVMESSKIVKEIEKLRPQPSLHLDEALERRVQGAVGTLFKALMPSMMYKVRDGLSARSAEYYESSRKPIVGMGLDELAESEAAQKTWINVDGGVHEIAAILHECPGGPYIQGAFPSYADLILAAGWHALFQLDPPTVERLCTYDAAFEKHYKACYIWLQRDSY